MMPAAQSYVTMPFFAEGEGVSTDMTPSVLPASAEPWSPTEFCSQCNRPVADRERRYPKGWWPPPGEHPESAVVPDCCPRYIDYGTLEDRWRRDLDCLLFGVQYEAPLPLPHCGLPNTPDALALNGACRYCNRRDCGRLLTVGSPEDHATRAFACAAYTAAELRTGAPTDNEAVQAFLRAQDEARALFQQRQAAAWAALQSLLKGPR